MPSEAAPSIEIHSLIESALEITGQRIKEILDLGLVDLSNLPPDLPSWLLQIKGRVMVTCQAIDPLDFPAREEQMELLKKLYEHLFNLEHFLRTLGCL